MTVSPAGRDASTVLVTGGAGFIGGHFVRELLAADPRADVVVLDRLTYAADPRTVAELERTPRVRLVRGDVGDRARVRALLAAARPDAIVHFAAETHVDRSIAGPDPFVATNVGGTFALLEELRAYLAAGGRARLLHVSTDEVYGALADGDPPFTEASPYAPRSPYAASKAAADHLVRAYVHTYALPAIISICGNNFGPRQHAEKLIPLTITRALAGQPLPVYGAGANVRDWIYVSDHCAALRAILARGRDGETYLIGARGERRNLDVVHAICDRLDARRPRAGGASHRALITFVADRPGHDHRYAIDPARLERGLGWRAETSFDDGLDRAIAWHLAPG